MAAYLAKDGFTGALRILDGQFVQERIHCAKLVRIDAVFGFLEA